MLFKNLLQSYFNDSIDQKMNDKLKKVEKRMDCLEKELKEAQSPIIVEHISIEQIHLDKLEFNNNFGSLGIKELKGKLNIGANYGDKVPVDSLINKNLFNQKKDTKRKETSVPSYQSLKPKVTIKPKAD